MNESGTTAQIDQARQAVTLGDWQQAYDLLAEADAVSPLSPPGLALLSDVAYATGHLAVTIDACERLHTEFLRGGDQLSAAGAAVRVALHLLLDTALLAPVRGWIRQVDRLLEGRDETPVHAWLAVVRNYERLLSGDFEGAREWARRAIVIGNKHDPAAAAIGRVAEARSLILDGDVDNGLRLLEEAGAAILPGQIEPISTGIIYCEIVCGLQGLAQYDLAEQWTEAMERWHHGLPVGSIHGRCRVHRAEILRLRGSHLDAEKEALLACEELRPYLRRELGWPLTELGRIRLRMGNIEGAKQAFMAAHEAGWDPQPGLAMLYLAEGDVGLAAASIREALAHPLNVPSKEFPPNTELRRAPLLEAQVEIYVLAGEVEEAWRAAQELSQIASKFKSQALAGSAALSLGRAMLAQGDAPGARSKFEEAARLWNEVGAPYETALSRIGVGRSFQAEGKGQHALLEFRAASSALERVGARREAERATQLARDVESGVIPTVLHGVKLPHEAVFRRDGDYWQVTFEGQTVLLRDMKGLHYLARLLADSGREFHVFDLVALERGDSLLPRRGTDGLRLSSSTDAGELLDAPAKEAYRRRLAEIDEDIEDARAMGDDERAARSATERDFLIRELTRAFGLGGRDRVAGSASERARVSITRSIRQAMARIQEHNPLLGEHLQHCIHTGTYCAYRPDPRLSTLWKI
jgi:tetratricopeptide (TPR) repeat protein